MPWTKTRWISYGAFDYLPHYRGTTTEPQSVTLQTLPASDEPFDDPVGQVAGFNLHAGVAGKAHERKKLERLCRYIVHPAVSEKRLSLTPNGNVRYQLKTPYRDGTTHVIFEPLDFIARLAALVPKPRANLTRFHGVFAPNSKHRVQVTPAKQGKGSRARTEDETQDQTPAERRDLMSCAQRLKRVFNIDIETCRDCAGKGFWSSSTHTIIVVFMACHLHARSECIQAKPAIQYVYYSRG